MLLLCNYYLTYKCNASCSFCGFANHETFAESENADIENVKSNLQQLAKLGVKFVDFTGGEPLLYKNIVDAVNYAHQLNYQTSITTNTLLYSKYAEKLAGKINLLHFSLDSPDKEEHDSIRGVKCYDKVFESIKIAKSLNEFPDILFTVTNDTYQKLPRMHRLAADNGLVLIVNPVFSYFGNPGLSLEAVTYIEDYIKGKNDVYINAAFLTLRKNGGNRTEKPHCKAVSRVIVISPDNKILLPCYHLANESIAIDKPIKEIRNSEKIKLYKKMEGRFDFCEGCTINCYFEPSFAFPVNYYSIVSLSSKFKYSYQKLVKQKIEKRKHKVISGKR